jgi:hypothetical protein
MAWSTIRRATADDQARLAAAAERFATRHDLDISGADDPVMALDCAIYMATDYGAEKRLPRLWAACVRRALRCRCDGIAYGYVGNSVE